MPNYTKLFNSIITSTIWSEDDKTRIIWITMLAMSDKNGEVHASIPGLARVASMDISAAESAIEKLMSPDPYSRTPDNEGRRIAKIDGGWELLNHGKYRLMASKEDEKAATAERVRRHRSRVTVCNGDVTTSNGDVTVGGDIAEAEAESIFIKKKRDHFQKPSEEEVAIYGSTLNPPFKKAASFVSHYDSNGWKVGKNSMKDWKAAVRTWQQKDKENPEKPKHRPIHEEAPYHKTGNGHRPLWD